MVYFIGAGPGDPELLTIKGKKIIDRADVIIYAGSLVNPQVMADRKPEAVVYDSAGMHLDQVIAVMEQAEKEGLTTARVHTGDPAIYGAHREQMDRLDEKKIAYDVCPGVSSFCGAASSLHAELTLPGVSQSVIITRMAGRTGVPERESFRSLAAHHATMAVFLSTGLLSQMEKELAEAGYESDTPAVIIYKATWPEEKIVRCTVSTLAKSAEENGIKKTAMIFIGDVFGTREANGYEESRLYAPDFSTEFRKGTDI